MTDKRKNIRNVPNLRFPSFVGEWEEKRLGDVGEFKNGINKSIGDFGFGVPFVNLMDVFGKPSISSNIGLGLVNAKSNEITLYQLKQGDVLFIRSSVKRSGVGESCVVMLDLPQTVYSGFLIRFRDSKLSLDLNFKKYCFTTKKFRCDLLALSTTSANTNINQDSLDSLTLFMPSSFEQKKIASFLSLIDSRIQTQNKIIEELKLLKNSLSKKIFTLEVRFPNFNREWETATLGSEGMFFSGGTPSTSKRQYYNGDIPFIKSGEIGAHQTEQFITEEGLKNSSAKMIRIGDLIYALYGATSGEVGISKIKGAINQAILCIRTNLDNVFLMSYLRLQKESILKTYLQGGQGNLSAEIIKSLKIPFPTPDEQSKISNFSLALDGKIGVEISLLQQMEHQKKYLLQNLFI